MNLSEPFIRRPVMTVVLTVSVLLFGVVAYFGLPVSDLPAVDYPVIQVQVNYPGATPDSAIVTVGLTGSLPDRVSVPDCGPAAFGANRTLTAWDKPAPTSKGVTGLTTLKRAFEQTE